MVESKVSGCPECLYEGKERIKFFVIFQSTTVVCVTWSHHPVHHSAEAMFADLGHFNKSSVQVSFSTVVYPSLILAYSGQAAYLIKYPSQLSTTFYSSIPGPLF